MKRTVSMLYASTLIAAIAMVGFAAPDVEGQQMWIGVKAGGVSSDFSPAQEWKASQSFTAGVFAQVRVAPSFFLATELTHVGLGAHEEGGPGSVEYRYGQIQVPLLAILQAPPETATLLPMVFAGPSLGLRTGCSIRRSNPAQAWRSCAQGLADYGSREPRKIEPALLWGVGADVRTSAGRIRIELRRQDALLNSMAQDPYFSRPPRNVSYIASAGFALQLGRQAGAAPGR